jgi:asparagine synthase (glutamine-hydrolysing)
VGNRALDDTRVRTTLDLMRNRGPDNQAQVSFESSGQHAALLHSRLSILDLDPRSNQPFTIDDFTMVFNGEIYNYVELRERLEKEGVGFITTSDTEVLLRYYIRHGPECVDLFEGMWAFAVWDHARGRLFLSRDRFAEKPLYLYRDDTGFYFGSEVKFIAGLLGHGLTVNHRQVVRYMVNGYKSLYKTDETWFEGLRELPYASWLLLNADGDEAQRRYWSPRHAPCAMSRKEAVEGFRSKLIDSVGLRLRSDVPIAFCLSGGLDSTSIVSIAAKHFGYDVATFSIIDSDERYNELPNIRATLDDLRCKHTLIPTSTEGFFERLQDLVAYHDAPLYTISYYVHSFLSEAIAEQGYKVVCSGTGADEMVTGYYDHFNLYLYEMRNSPCYARYLEEWRTGPGTFVRNPFLKNPELYFDNPGFRDHIYLNNRDFAALMKEPFDEPFTEVAYCEALLQNRMMNEMYHEGTRVILHEDDLNSMKYSIENRSPYLDRWLFEFCYTIPTEHLVHAGLGKSVLRDAMEGLVTDRVRLDPYKKGFNASITSLVDFEDDTTQARIFADSPIYDIVDRERLRKAVPGGSVPNSMSKFWFYFLNAKVFMEQQEG